MDTSRRALIAMLSRSIPRTKKVLERIQKRMAEGLCLSRFEVERDGKTIEEDCQRVAGRSRGVCESCYAIFLKEASKGSREESLQYEQDLIAAGLILADREKLQLKSKSLLRRRRA